MYFDINIFKTVIFNNSLYDWMLALLFFLVVVFLLKIFNQLLVVELKRSEEKEKINAYDLVIVALNAIHWPFYVLVSFYLSLNFLLVADKIKNLTYYILLTSITYYFTKIFHKFIDFSFSRIKKTREKEGDKNVESIKFISLILKILIWIVAGLFVISNLGYNINSLIAGLGIGGVTLAFAMQRILADMFSSFSLYFNHTFKEGDYVVIDKYSGVIKKVGLMSTKILSFNGASLVIPNNQLVSAKIENYGPLKQRMIVSSLGIAYNTSANKIKALSSYIKEIIDKHPEANLKRVHLKTLASSGIIYEIAYTLSAKDYSSQLDIEEAINFAILEKLKKEKIEIK